MDYREIAEEFCSIRAWNAKTMAGVEKCVSARGEAGVLLLLSQAGREVLAGQIARSLELSASRGTNIVNSLERKGLVQRRSGSADKRKVYISLTQNGKSYIEAKHQEAVRRFERIFQRLGKEDSEAYLRIMKRFLELMEDEIQGAEP